MIHLVLAAAINWPVQYNGGVTAYRSNDFTTAASAFEQATAAKDRELQRRAFYNLGNTSYRLGEADPTKAQPLWERAIKSYETALALDPKDEDAKFNQDYVKKKLEELKKQQEQQKQQQEQQQNQKNQDQQKKDQEKKQDQPQQQNQQQQQPEQQPKQDEQKQDQAQPKPEPSQPKEPPQEQQPQQAQAGNLDKQEAKALLDNLREDERNWNFFPEVQMKDLKDAGEPAKDW
jgi:Ca-activated chloride channel family protein